MAGAADDLITKIVEWLKSMVGIEPTKFQPSPTDQAVAYTSIMLMALFPIVLGAFKSVTHQRKQKESGEKPDIMTIEDVAMSPVITSGILFGLYICFKYFSKQCINRVFTGFYFLLGILDFFDVMSSALSHVLRSLLPSDFYRWEYRISFQGCSTSYTKKREKYFDYRFSCEDIACSVSCCLFVVWYLWKKHWVASNLFALALAVNSIELQHINTLATGCILLGGLCLDDIFWGFFTDVMETVVRSLNAPLKLVFPLDFLENGFAGRYFSILGLGDIIIPGMFIAFLLRFDSSLNRQKNIYFMSSLVAYVLGLALTIFISVYFDQGQPALLYLVPACIGVPLTLAAIMGDISALLKSRSWRTAQTWRAQPTT